MSGPDTVVPDVLGIDLGSTGLEPLRPEETCDLPLLTELWLAVEELLFGLGAGRNGTKGGAALDKVDAGRLPKQTYFSTPLD